MNKLESYDEIETDKEFIDKEIKKAKFRFLESLNKTHNIVIHIRNSDNRADYVKKLTEKIILMDNRTRWNS
jgi:hypothetical protein